MGIGTSANLESKKQRDRGDPSLAGFRMSADGRTLLARGAAERMLLASAIILVLWLAVAWALA